MSSTYDDKLAMILRTAAAVFAERGYHRASIRDISRATGVSLSGLYYYFESKEELLFLLQDHCFRAVLESAERVARETREPERRLRRLIESHLRFFVANMDEMKVLSHEAEALDGEYGERVNALKRRYTSIFKDAVEALRPADSAVDPHVSTFALFGMMNWIYNWYRPQGDVAASELVEQLTALFLSGHLNAGAVVSASRGEGEIAPSMWKD